MKLHKFLDKYPQYEEQIKDKLKEAEFEQAMKAKDVSSLTLHGMVFVDAPASLEGPISVERQKVGRSTNLVVKPVP